MKYKNMNEVSHGFRKKYKIPQKLVYVTVTISVNILNLTMDSILLNLTRDGLMNRKEEPISLLYL